MDWTQISASLTNSSLRDLASGRASAIVVSNFLSEEERRLSLAAFGRAVLGEYAHIGASLKRAGVAQSEFFGMDGGEARYFERAAEFARDNPELEADRVRLFGKVLDALRATGLAADVLKGRGGKPFSAGVYRLATALRLHSDWVRRDAVGWTNDDIDAQLAINVHLSRCERGGELLLYNRFWEAPHERWKRADGYGYEEGVVLDAPRVVIVPQPGDLIIFNCKNYHEVRTTQGGERVTFGVHLGMRGGSSLVCWS
jgi:hypothetical protein